VKDKIVKLVKRHKVTTGILVFFLVWMMFFDEYNWVRIHKDSRNLKELEESKQYYKEKIENDRQKLYELKTDTQALERFAREEYFLKKENEDVFVIIEK